MSLLRSITKVFCKYIFRQPHQEGVEDGGVITVRVTYSKATTKRIGYSINHHSSGSFSRVLDYDELVECDENMETNTNDTLLGFEIDDIHIGDRIFIGIELRDGNLNAKTIKVDSASSQVLHLVVKEGGDVVVCESGGVRKILGSAP